MQVVGCGRLQVSTKFQFTHAKWSGTPSTNAKLLHLWMVFEKASVMGCAGKNLFTLNPDYPALSRQGVINGPLYPTGK